MCIRSAFFLFLAISFGLPAHECCLHDLNFGFVILRAFLIHILAPKSADEGRQLPVVWLYQQTDKSGRRMKLQFWRKITHFRMIRFFHVSWGFLSCEVGSINYIFLKFHENVMAAVLIQVRSCWRELLNPFLDFVAALTALNCVFYSTLDIATLVLLETVGGVCTL